MDRQGLFFYEGTSQVPAITFIILNIVPTAVALIYASLWHLVDIDVKRLEPCFQLSRAGVLTETLFEDYAFQYLLLVPYRVFKARHWTLAAASITNILVAIILPPLWNGIFTVVPTTLFHDVDFSSNQALVNHSMEANLAYVGADTIPHTSSIMLHGAALPGFATREYGVAPFDRAPGGYTHHNESWTVGTSLYGASPRCIDVPSLSHAISSAYKVTRESSGSLVLSTNATMDIVGIPNCSMNISARVPLDEHQETVEIYAPMLASPQPHFPEIRADPYATIIESDASCLPMDIFAILVRVSRTNKQSDPPHKIVYIPEAVGPSCSIQYFSAPGKANIQAPNNSVLLASADQISRTNLGTNGSSFNPLSFLLNLFGLDRFDPGNHTVTDPDEDVIMNALPLITGESLATMAYSSMPRSLTMDPTAWIDALNDSIKLSFAVASKNYVDMSSPAKVLTGSQKVYLLSIQVTNVIALLSEGILFIAALASASLAVVYKRRPNVIRTDPDSITSLCSLLACSLMGKTAITESTADVYGRSTERLVESCQTLQPCKSPTQSINEKDRCAPDQSKGTCIEIKCNQSDASTGSRQEPRIHGKQLDDRESRNPDLLSFLFSSQGLCISIATLVSFIVLASALLLDARNRQGYRFLAAADPFLSQLFWSFTPGIVASLIGSLWNTIHRNMSVLEPWVQLSRRYTEAKGSISVRYGSRSSYTVLLDSLFHRHWILIIVSAIALSTNILSIAMGALFLQLSESIWKDVNAAKEFLPSNLSSNWSASMRNVDAGFSLLRTNLTDRTPLPPWTSDG